MLKLSLFGSLSASFAVNDDEAISLALPARPSDLLAFLALHRGSYFSRSQIIQSLWDDHAGSGTVGSFNTALWRLRKVIERSPAKPGDFIVANAHGAVGLNGCGDLWLDVAEFVRLTHAGLTKPLHQIGEHDIRDMQMGISLYSGDFLADVANAWALSERERLRRSYINTLGRLVELSSIRRNYESAIQYSLSILDKDPLREDVHRGLMRYFVLNGQRALALRQYELCRQWLRQELAVQPMKETMLLYQRIADSAIGSRDDLENNLFTTHESTIAPEPIWLSSLDQLFNPDRSDLPADDHISIARRLIAEADQHLQAEFKARKIERA